MALGSPKTKKALIGTFELRIGPLNKAGLLTSDHSVGIVDQVKLDMQMDSVDLLAGFPQKPVDTAITKFITGFTATLRESSRRNLNVLLGNQLADYDPNGSDVTATVNTTSAINVAVSTITLNSAVTLSAGDTVVIYDMNNPGNVSIVRVASSSTGTTVTIDSNTPIVGPGGGATVAFTAGSQVRLYKAATIPGGAITGVPNYFAAQLLRLDRGTGRPVGFSFWKTAISAGMSLSSTVTEFASLDLQLKALEPAAAEFSVGGPLQHLAAIIPSSPVFQAFDVSDAASGAMDVLSPYALLDALGLLLTDSTGSPLLALPG